MVPPRTSALLLALVVLGCKRGSAEERRWTPCSCAYVTDYDDPGKITVEVCAEPTQALSAAQSCAQGVGVGAVTECTCPLAVRSRCGERDTCRDPVVRQ
ncbi:MAG TPA: hypothetical protein VF881_06330 [Polyangiaceae bacterium]